MYKFCAQRAHNTHYAPSSLLFTRRIGEQQWYSGWFHCLHSANVLSASPMWDPKRGCKHFCMAMASRKSTQGRKLKATSILGCVFGYFHDTTLPKSWVSP